MIWCGVIALNGCVPAQSARNEQNAVKFHGEVDTQGIHNEFDIPVSAQADIDITKKAGKDIIGTKSVSGTGNTYQTGDSASTVKAIRYMGLVTFAHIIMLCMFGYWNYKSKQDRPNQF